MKFTIDYINKYIAENSDKYLPNRNLMQLIESDYYNRDGFLRDISTKIKLPEYQVKEIIIAAQDKNSLNKVQRTINNSKYVMQLSEIKQQLQRNIATSTPNLFEDTLFQLGFILDYANFEIKNNTIIGYFTYEESKITFKMSIYCGQAFYKIEYTDKYVGDMIKENNVEATDIVGASSKVTEREIKSNGFNEKYRTYTNVDKKENTSYYDQTGIEIKRIKIKSNKNLYCKEDKNQCSNNNVTETTVMYRLAIDGYVISRDTVKYLYKKDIPTYTKENKARYRITYNPENCSKLPGGCYYYGLDADIAEKAINGDIESIKEAIEIYEKHIESRGGFGSWCGDGYSRSMGTGTFDLR